MMLTLVLVDEEERHDIEISVLYDYIIVRCGDHLDFYDEWPDECVHCGHPL